MSSTAAEQSFQNKFVLVTGASGFLGGRLAARLRELGARVVGTSSGRRRSEYSAYDLTNPKQAEQLFKDYRFDYVFHCAGDNGGIGVNLSQKARLFTSNTQLALNVVSYAALFGVKKLVGVVASCAYPMMAWHGGCEAEIMEEEHFLGSQPHPSVAGHAYAKRNLQLACQYFSNPNFRAVTVCPATLYGPGQSYEAEKTKVVAAMVKRFCDAVDTGQKEVVCWGSGKPLREVLYIDDCVELLINVFLSYDDPSVPLNLGTGQEFTIKQIAEKCAAAVNYEGTISWDNTKADGQYRKRLNCSRLKELVPGFVPTLFESGLLQAVADYRGKKL